MWVSRGGLNSTAMAGGLTVVGSSVVVVDSHSSPCMCMDGMTMMKRSRAELWRLSSRSGVANHSVCSKRKKSRGLVVVSELGGQYEDTFEDVKRQIQNYFTYKAVRTVMTQLYEMNPPLYRWFYDFVVSNKPGDGKRFIRSLAKEKQDLAERVMVTRLHLYGKWAKKCDHAEIYKEISDENLELMRERLMETVIWPTDDTNTEKTEA